MTGQRLPKGIFFEIDEYSVVAVSRTLMRLDLSDCRLTDIKLLYYLDGLDYLNLSSNLIVEIDDIL